MSNRVYSGSGVVFIDANLTNPNSCLKSNTRLSLCLEDEYVGIVEIQLEEGMMLPNGKDHKVDVRLISPHKFTKGTILDIRDPIARIGSFQVIELRESVR